MAFLVGMVGVSGYGILNGDPNLLLTTWDYDGNGCGYNETTKDYPYLYFPALDTSGAQSAVSSAQSGNAGGVSTGIMETLKYSTCVKECPLATGPVNCYKPTFMSNNAAKYLDCVYYYGGTSVTSSAFRYETAVVMGKFCVPAGEHLA